MFNCLEIPLDEVTDRFDLLAAAWDLLDSLVEDDDRGVSLDGLVEAARRCGITLTCETDDAIAVLTEINAVCDGTMESDLIELLDCATSEGPTVRRCQNCGGDDMPVSREGDTICIACSWGFYSDDAKAAARAGDLATERAALAARADVYDAAKRRGVDLHTGREES